MECLKTLVVLDPPIIQANSQWLWKKKKCLCAVFAAWKLILKNWRKILELVIRWRCRKKGRTGRFRTSNKTDRYNYKRPSFVILKNVNRNENFGILSGYGKFNYLLLLAILPAGCASIYSSTSMSYVLPSAECDLSLTLFDKGLLNSMPFAGTVLKNIPKL